MFLVKYSRMLYLALLASYCLDGLACTVSARAVSGQRRIAEQEAYSGMDTRSFDFYQAKTYEFLKYLYGRIIRYVSVKRMDPADDTFGADCPAYASGNNIFLNIDVLQHYSDADNLFICAHEAAHHYCGHTHVSAHNADRSSIDLEQEADEVAARMLCTHGYRWVVEDCVQLLLKDIHRGYGHVSDEIHPTSAQKYSYLQNILDNKPTPAYASPARMNKNTGYDAPSSYSLAALIQHLYDYVADSLNV